MGVRRIINISSNSLVRFSNTIKFKKGQIYKGTVISSKGKDILLKISNQTIKAKAQAYVTEGQTLKLLVEDVSKQQIRLKIINENNTTLKAAESILQNMGIKPTSELQEVLNLLINFRLPLNEENIFFFNSFNNTNMPQLIPLAIWLKTLNIEGDLENLIRLYNFFKGKLDEREEQIFFNFLNKQETQILGNYNIFGWPFFNSHLYMFSQNPKQKKIFPEHCFLVLKVKSKALGDLWFKVNYKNHKLFIDVVCQDDEVQKIINDELNTLYAALLGAGYQDLNLKTRVEPIDTVLDFVPGPTPEDVNYVNFRI